MAFRNYFLIVATFVIFQNASGIHWGREQRDLLQQASQSVADLNKIVTARIADSIADLNKNMNSLDSFSKSTLQTATVLLENSVSISLQQIKDVRESAIAHGKDPSHCIADSEEIIKNRPVETINTMVACINEQINTASATVTKAIQNISEQIQVVYNLENKLSGCATGIPGTDCYVEVLTEATKQSATLPGHIVSLEIAAENSVDAAKEEVVTCTITKANVVENEISQLTQSISDCVKNL